MGEVVSIKRMAVLFVVLAVILLAAGGLIALTHTDSASPTPISAQSCHELAATERQIQADLGPEQSSDIQAAAGKHAEELNTRVDKLGGCPSEPDLQ